MRHALSLVATALLAGGCFAEPPVGDDSDLPELEDTDHVEGVTWWQDVRPIIVENCISCHYEGADTFPLETYEQVKSLGGLLLAKMSDDDSVPFIMPPWPIPDSEECAPPVPWLDDQRLSPETIATFREWVETGAAEGDEATATPTSAPIPQTLTGNIIQDLPGVNWTIPASDTDFDYTHCFSMPLDLVEESYLRGIDINPDNTPILHHIIIATDPTGATAPPEGEPENYACNSGEDIPDSVMLYTYIRNTGAFYFPPDSAMTMQPGSRLVVTIHYHQKPYQQYDNTSVSLEWAEEKPKYNAWMDRFGGASRTQVDWDFEVTSRGWIDPPFLIPAGETNWYEEWDEVWKGDDRPLWGIFPHMHYIGKDIKMYLKHSDGTEECLSHIAHWDAAWQQHYMYDAPFEELPVMGTGDTVRIECLYDNSFGSERLAQSMEADGLTELFDMTVGEGGYDEMCVMHYGTMVEQ